MGDKLKAEGKEKQERRRENHEKRRRGIKRYNEWV